MWLKPPLTLGGLPKRVQTLSTTDRSWADRQADVDTKARGGYREGAGGGGVHGRVDAYAGKSGRWGAVRRRGAVRRCATVGRDTRGVNRGRRGRRDWYAQKTARAFFWSLEQTGQHGEAGTSGNSNRGRQPHRGRTGDEEGEGTGAGRDGGDSRRDCGLGKNLSSSQTGERGEGAGVGRKVMLEGHGETGG